MKLFKLKLILILCAISPFYFAHANAHELVGFTSSFPTLHLWNTVLSLIVEAFSSMKYGVNDFQFQINNSVCVDRTG